MPGGRGETKAPERVTSGRYSSIVKLRVKKSRVANGCAAAEWPMQSDDETLFGSNPRLGIFPCPRSGLPLTSHCTNLLRFQAFRG